jgi:uncharacterized membrane protein YbhN (UPF0104 family)
MPVSSPLPDQEAESLPNSRKKSPLTFIVRAGISIALAAFVYLTVDRKRLFDSLQSVSWSGMALIFLLYIIGQFLSAWKWRVFVSCVGLQRSPVEILRAYFFGMFVNVFGFGTVGGDVARSMLLNPPKGRRAGALATVLADRIHGLGVLLSIGTIAVAIVRPEALGRLNSFLILGGIGGLAALSIFWWFGPQLLTKIVPENHKWGGAILRVTQAFPREAKPFAAATAISFAFHNVQLLMHVIIAKELGVPLSASYIYATVPFVNIVASLPISVFNGLGVREGMYCLLFIPAGVPKATAVAFGAIWLFTVTVISSVGILFLTPDMKRLVRRGKRADEQADADAYGEQETSRQRALG